jgi:hydroxymethylpyrimidine pyrophosphatase-like HAD family hydrolase
VRSLHEMPVQTARNLLGVAFDIDDTVTRHGRLELAAFRAMHELAEAGLHLVAATGRPIGWIEVVVRHWPISVGVGENGAGWIWRDENGFRENYFDPPERRICYGDLFDRVRKRVARELPHVKLSNDGWARRCDLAFDVGETVKLPRDEIARLLCAIEAEGARSNASSVHAHAIPGEWNKARGIVRAVRDGLGLDVEEAPERWLFIGDSGNDAPAFDYFPVSVGVSNVREVLGQLATPPAYITTADRGEGFAEMAEHVLRARGAPASESA